MIFLYPEDVREATSQPSPSFFHQFVQRALKYALLIEQSGNSSFIWLKRISNFVQKISNSSWL